VAVAGSRLDNDTVEDSAAYNLVRPTVSGYGSKSGTDRDLDGHDRAAVMGDFWDSVKLDLAAGGHYAAPDTGKRRDSSSVEDVAAIGQHCAAVTGSRMESGPCEDPAASSHG